MVNSTKRCERSSSSIAKIALQWDEKEGKNIIIRSVCNFTASNVFSADSGFGLWLAVSRNMPKKGLLASTARLKFSLGHKNLDGNIGSRCVLFLASQQPSFLYALQKLSLFACPPSTSLRHATACTCGSSCVWALCAVQLAPQMDHIHKRFMIIKSKLHAFQFNGWLEFNFTHTSIILLYSLQWGMQLGGKPWMVDGGAAAVAKECDTQRKTVSESHEQRRRLLIGP